jgi:hypothetical protein
MGSDPFRLGGDESLYEEMICAKPLLQRLISEAPRSESRL